MNILQALIDRAVLGFAFAGDTWRSWRIILAGAFGLPLIDSEAETFRSPHKSRSAHLTLPRTAGAGRSPWRQVPHRRSHRCVPRHAQALGTGRRRSGHGAPPADRDQARVEFRYVLGLLESSPILSQEIHSTTADTIRLVSGIEICIGTSDKAAVRGRTLIAVVCDEIAFWGADADEVMRAIRPGMASQPEAMLVMITTTYSQRGPAFDLFRRSYGTDDPRWLVCASYHPDLNESIPQSFIDDELARDPQAAAAEYLAEFRNDLEALFDAALLDRATRPTPRELPYTLHTPSGGFRQYHAAVDVSGGRQDAAAAAVTYRDGDSVVVAACRRWPSPHDPVQVAKEVAAFRACIGSTALTPTSTARS